jgi:hypothetical protein
MFCIGVICFRMRISQKSIKKHKMSKIESIIVHSLDICRRVGTTLIDAHRNSPHLTNRWVTKFDQKINELKIFDNSKISLFLITPYCIQIKRNFLSLIARFAIIELF